MEIRFRQAGGLKHCKNIRRIAKRIWKDSNYRYGAWDECLRKALRSHAENIYRSQRIREELKAQREKELNQSDLKRRQDFQVGCF